MVDEDDIINQAAKDGYIEQRGMFNKTWHCVDCLFSMPIEIDYCVTDSWQGWIVTCPNCGTIKEYDA